MIPDARHYDPVLGAYLSTGQPARAAAHGFTGGTLAVDTETPGLADPFTIKCVTASWHGGDGTIESILLDPARRPADHQTVRALLGRADHLVFHNAPFDVSGLAPSGLIDAAGINRITDTLVIARMAYPDTLVRKSLSALAASLLGMNELKGGIEMSFKAAGHRTREAGYFHMDIDAPIYRFGAMADTTVTLRLLPLLIDAAVETLTDHPFTAHGCTVREQALDLIEREQIVNRVMLRRTAKGFAVDRDYLDNYRDEVAGEVARAERELHEAGIERPGNGDDLMAALDRLGVLPEDWARTATGKLSSAKGHLTKLDHPLAVAHRQVANTTKIVGYLDGVAARSRVTGRLHPQAGVLGASATGRMSYAEPALQQFPKEARPMILADEGTELTSIDWAQIEPVTLANVAGDAAFLAPFEAGGDLYEPIMRAAGCDRNTAKVVLLATTYGQGDTKLAATLGMTIEGAAQIKRQMLAAMPESAKFMGKLSHISAAHGQIVTANGRILPIPKFQGEYMAYKGVNYFVQGSAYDVLADSIIRCEREGLADHIALAMHDELVVEADADEAIADIMRTAPEFLTRWAGRVPVLRVDAQTMGNRWHKV